MEQINALTLLKDELDTDEVHLKVNAIHRLKTVVLSMQSQPESIGQKLIPYIQYLTQTEEDQVLFAIAEQIGVMWELLGNPLRIFPLLEKLCAVQQTVVRDQAAKSLCKIAKTLPESDIQNQLAPLTLRLAGDEWFTSRVSACSLFFDCYQRSGSQKEKLRKKFVDLCTEQTPMVRRAGATRLGDFATQVQKPFVLSELVPVFRQLANDEQDTIRVLCIDSLVALAKYLNKQENQVHTLGVLLQAGEDKSWKVRLAFARNFADLAKAFGKDITDANLIQTFTLFLKDAESEVRNAAIQSLKDCIKLISIEKINSLVLPNLEMLYQDSSPIFRAGVATVVSITSTIMGKEATVAKILPLVQQLIKDDNHDVRLSATEGLKMIAQVMGYDILSTTLITTLSTLTKDGQWRVRQAVYRLLGDLAIGFGKQVFLNNLETIYFGYLMDNAATVRDQGIKKTKVRVIMTVTKFIQQISDYFKVDWVIGKLIPKIVQFLSKQKLGYLHRMAGFNTIKAIVPLLTKDQIVHNVLNIFLNAALDQVPNVRFGIAKILKEVANLVDSATVQGDIKPALNSMTSDQDKDVSHFAKIALNAC